MVSSLLSGSLTTPPQAAGYIALATAEANPGLVHGSRPRQNTDTRGYDCNDYAYDAVQALKAQGRDPVYVAAQDEKGEGHMIAVYPTQDGALYARDNRVDGDIPLDRLTQRGYKLISAADSSAQSWHAIVK